MSWPQRVRVVRVVAVRSDVGSRINSPGCNSDRPSERDGLPPRRPGFKGLTHEKSTVSRPELGHVGSLALGSAIEVDGGDPSVRFRRELKTQIYALSVGDS